MFRNPWFLIIVGLLIIGAVAFAGSTMIPAASPVVSAVTNVLSK